MTGQRINLISAVPPYHERSDKCNLLLRITHVLVAPVHSSLANDRAAKRRVLSLVLLLRATSTTPHDNVETLCFGVNTRVSVLLRAYSSRAPGLCHSEQKHDVCEVGVIYSLEAAATLAYMGTSPSARARLSSTLSQNQILLRAHHEVRKLFNDTQQSEGRTPTLREAVVCVAQAVPRRQGPPGLRTRELQADPQLEAQLLRAGVFQPTTNSTHRKLIVGNMCANRTRTEPCRSLHVSSSLFVSESKACSALVFVEDRLLSASSTRCSHRSVR